MTKPVIAVWFSCGAASAVAAKLTLDQYRDTHTVRVLNNPILEEGEDNQRFLRDVSGWLDWPIEHVINPKYPLCSTADVFERNKAMVFPHGEHLVEADSAKQHAVALSRAEFYATGRSARMHHRSRPNVARTSWGK